jgi:hypothetical protein
MRRNVRVGSVFLVVSLALLACAFASVFAGCGGMPISALHRLLLGEDYVSKNIEFKQAVAGNGHTPSGTAFDFQIVRASDCVEVIAKRWSEGSAEKADQELERLVITASRVVEQGTKSNRENKPVGKRAVLLFGTPPNRAIIAWTTKNGLLVTVESVSLAHALKYEQRID